MSGPSRNGLNGLSPAGAPLILASLFFFFSACFHACSPPAYAQSFPVPTGTKLTKPRLSDEEIAVFVTDEDGYWINEHTARACLVQEDVAKGCAEKWKACETKRAEQKHPSRWSAYAIGFLAGAAASFAFVLAVQR